MKLGIVGLPNVGKSTLFNAITKAGAEIANYAFCTIEPNIGVVGVPDERLEVLARQEHSAKITKATIEFFDIAGLVEGASHGEGLGNKFLANIREVDAIIHVCRCFEDENISHVVGSINPIRDFETVELELILSDIEQLERRMEKLERTSRSNDAALLSELRFVKSLLSFLEQEQPAREYILENDEEKEMMKNLFLLTSKPILVVANVAEADAADGNEYFRALSDYFAKDKVEVICISAQIEAEIQELQPEEHAAFLKEIGLKESGLDRLIRASYKTLGLISFLTAGATETRAWTTTAGAKAPQAAGVIHSDFERGFIAAEVVPFDILAELGSLQKAKEKGCVRKEGKKYEIQDGDVVLFRFNV
ncbi:MAG: redox-regulated ATPase YchF [Saccharofermentanales bacterium]|jgi:GTP-binding protein YchF|nr:redox-regulated ATPase YchF [Eubacteriales bacterium]MDD3611315.1 redox-regulated ATPase YchF [Eubacteriales bacterium]HHU03450.1 redox-regulated ATPase YchF [Fastidiosipila sp.]